MVLVERLKSLEKSGESASSVSPRRGLQPQATITIRQGDILLGRLEDWHDAYQFWGFWRHIGGVLIEPFGNAWVVEAISTGVSSKKTISDFFRQYKQVAVLRVIGAPSNKLTSVALKMDSQRGKPYRLGKKVKTSDNPPYFYCSGLAWFGYKKVLGVDLDYNGGSYVMPDDIFRDEDVEVIYWLSRK